MLKTVFKIMKASTITTVKLIFDIIEFQRNNDYPQLLNILSKNI